MASKPAAPKHLSTEARRLYVELGGEYVIDDAAGKALLLQVCESLDRLRQAQHAIEAEGPVVEGRYGPRPHPMLQVEKDARNAMLAYLKSLNLDLEPLRDRPGRPAGF